MVIIMSDMSGRLKKLFKKDKYLMCAVLMAMLPLICCIFTCAVSGKTISQVSLLNSQWNDELFYYKQIEGIVQYGKPMGYFGYNESHALRGSFGAWSPVIFIPWVIWGSIFGWNLNSPIYCNIALMMVSMFIFVYVVKPSKRQLFILSVLYMSFRPLARYMLSGMPECFCFSLVIVVLALAVSYQEKKCMIKLLLLFLITCLLTLIRPYFILFFLYPSFEMIRERKIVGILCSIIIIAITMLIYAMISSKLTAEYFFPLIDVDWLQVFIDEGIGVGTKSLFSKWNNVIGEYRLLLLDGIKHDAFSGEYFIAFSVLLCTCLIYLIESIYKKYKNIIIYLWFAVCCAGTWTAIILMYKIQQGSKHLLAYLVGGIFLFSLMETRYLKKMLLCLGVFLILFVFSPVDPYEYSIPFSDEMSENNYKYWKGLLEEKIEEIKKESPSYKNTIIWVYNDEVKESWVATQFHVLYTVPAGMGINCCQRDFVFDNFEYLKSKYLVVVADGKIDKLCKSKGLFEIGRQGDTVVYELY